MYLVFKYNTFIGAQLCRTMRPTIVGTAPAAVGLAYETLMGLE